MGTFCLLNLLCPGPKLELYADRVLYKWFWLWWDGRPEMTVTRIKLINPTALILATVPGLIVFDSKIHPSPATGWLHGVLASVQGNPWKEPRPIRRSSTGGTIPYSWELSSGGLPSAVSHVREFSRDSDDLTFRDQGHQLLYFYIRRENELQGLMNKGQQARPCVWLGATYQPLLWKGAILVGAWISMWPSTLKWHSRLSPWWWHWEPTCNWITFAVDWSNSKQSGPNQEAGRFGKGTNSNPKHKEFGEDRPGGYSGGGWVTDLWIEGIIWSGSLGVEVYARTPGVGEGRLTKWVMG